MRPPSWESVGGSGGVWEIDLDGGAPWRGWMYSTWSGGGSRGGWHEPENALRTRGSLPLLSSAKGELMSLGAEETDAH